MLTPSSLVKKISPASLHFFFEFLEIKRRRFVLFCILSLLGLVSEAVGLGLIFPILDFMNQDGDVSALTQKSEFWRVGVDTLNNFGITVSLEVILSFFLFATFGRQIFDYVYMLKLGNFQLTILEKARAAIFERGQQLTARHHNNIKSGAYVNALTFQVEEVSNILPGYVRMFRYAVTFIIYACVLGLLNPLFVVLGVAQIALIAIPATYFISANRIFSTRLVSIRDDIVSFLNENFNGFREIKIFRLENEQRQNLEKLSKLFKKNTYAVFINSFRLPLIFGTLLGVAISVQLYVGFVMLDLTGTVLATFIIIIIRLAPTAQGFMKQKQALVKQRACLANLQNIIDEYSTNCEVPVKQITKKMKITSLQLRNVSFKYDDANQVLDDFSSSFKAGTISLIVGRSGTGKSTLLDILAGHLTPDFGEILVNGRLVSRDDLFLLRDNVSYASQESFLFSGSLEKNIILGTEFDSKKYDECLRLASASEIITEFSGRSYNPAQGAKNNLSGGQKQRITLARCYYRERSILLLDEPSSNLDIQTEQRILNSLKKLTKMQGLITILVSHNPDHRGFADQIVDI